MGDYQSIRIENKKFSSMAKNLLSGNVNTQEMVDCLHGLLIDSNDARERIAGVLLGVPVDFSNGIKKGDTALALKGNYYLESYDLEASINAGYVIELPENIKTSYRSHGIVVTVTTVRPHSNTITFDVSGKLIKSDSDEVVNIFHTLTFDDIIPFEDGKS